MYLIHRFEGYFILAVLLLVIVIANSCKDSDVAQMEAMGSKHKITMYGCDGKAIATWESTGNVSNEAQTDGWYFKDMKTGKLIEVTGAIVIEQE